MRASFVRVLSMLGINKRLSPETMVGGGDINFVDNFDKVKREMSLVVDFF